MLLASPSNSGRFMLCFCSTIKDAPLGTGDYSNAICHQGIQNSQLESSCRTRNVASTARKDCYSNVNPELTRIPVHKDTFGIMHLTAGIFDHELDAVREYPREVNAKSAWGRSPRQVEEDAALCVKNRNSNRKRMPKNVSRIQKNIDSLESYIKEGQAQENPDQSKIENWERSIDHGKAKRTEVVNSPDYGVVNRLEGGAEIILDCIEQFLSPS